MNGAFRRALPVLLWAPWALSCLPRPETRPVESPPVPEAWGPTPDVSAPILAEGDAGTLLVSSPAAGSTADTEAAEVEADAGVAQSAPPPPVQLATADPEIRAAFQRAVDAARAADLASAERELKAVVERDAALDYAWSNLGVVEERLGRPGEAERAYRHAIELKSDQDAAWGALARLYARTGRAVQLEAELRESISQRPENLALRNALLVVLVAQGKQETAINEAKKVLKADERNVRAMQQLALAYAGQGKLELARMVLENARAIDGSDAVTHNLLGNVYLQLKQRPQALESYEKATHLRPDYAEALNNHGALLNQAQDHEAAAKQLEAAVASAPGLSAARLNLGNAYRGLQRFDEARREYLRASELRPEVADTYFNLAVLHLDADGAPLDAIERLQSAIAYFLKYREKGGRDERVDQYLKDAQKGIEKEERRREREKKDQLRKAEQDAKEEAERRAAEAAPPAAPAPEAPVADPVPPAPEAPAADPAPPAPETPADSGKLRDQSEEK